MNNGKNNTQSAVSFVKKVKTEGVAGLSVMNMIAKLSLTVLGSPRSEECCPAEVHSLSRGMLEGLSGHAQYLHAGQDDNPVCLSCVI